MDEVTSEEVLELLEAIGGIARKIHLKTIGIQIQPSWNRSPRTARVKLLDAFG